MPPAGRATIAFAAARGAVAPARPTMASPDRFALRSELFSVQRRVQRRGSFLRAQLSSALQTITHTHRSSSVNAKPVWVWGRESRDVCVSIWCVSSLSTNANAGVFVSVKPGGVKSVSSVEPVERRCRWSRRSVALVSSRLSLRAGVSRLPNVERRSPPAPVPVRLWCQKAAFNACYGCVFFVDFGFPLWWQLTWVTRKGDGGPRHARAWLKHLFFRDRPRTHALPAQPRHARPAPSRACRTRPWRPAAATRQCKMHMLRSRSAPLPPGPHNVSPPPAARSSQGRT